MFRPAQLTQTSDKPRVLFSAKRFRMLFVHAALLGAGFIYVYPFIWMLGSSFKSRGDFFALELRAFPDELQVQNYSAAWSGASFGAYLANSLFISVISTFFVVLFTAMTGYVLSRFKFPGRNLLIGMIALLFFFHGGFAILPLYDLITYLGLIGTYQSLILVEISGGLVYFTVLFSGFFVTLPKELEESAAMDGASFPVVFWRIVLPQARPMTATVTLLFFISVWNSYFYPLVFTAPFPELRTLAVGLARFYGERSTEWPLVCAGAVMSILPVMILFVFLQRFFVDTIGGALKG
jgi:ABC-type glycerol-3-phosphate transport system permease component